MNVPHEFGSKQRQLRILVDLLQHQSGYTRRQLAQRYGVSMSTIKRDVDEIEYAGFVVEQDEKHRYQMLENKPYNQLKDLLHFGEEDQRLLNASIDHIDPHGKRGARLKRKLAALYDYRQLGHSNLRAPYLSKVNALRQAIDQQQVVILKDYHSGNSNSIEDRLIEPFHLDTAKGLLYAYDLNRAGIRHFKLPRFVRVQPTDRSWENEQRHVVETSDVFLVVDAQTVPVHIRMRVGGYNALVEQFPLAEPFVKPSGEEAEVYEFEAQINHRFLGLTNFLLGNYHHIIDVLRPEALVDHLRAAIDEFLEKLEG